MPLKRRLQWLRRSVCGSIHSAVDVMRGRGASSLRSRLAATPLMRAEKTYNTAHPDYKPELVGNFPGRIHHASRPCGNQLFLEIRKLAKRDMVPKRVWRKVHHSVLEEARAVPGFDQVMERKVYIEGYLAELDRRYGANYFAGWVNLVDALFLYWAVRRAKPKTIVQTGVSNGLSSAFMMLALAKNGPEGRLHSIDLPCIFDPAEAWWTQQGTIYGVVIPQGKSSGWMVPEVYRHRFEVEVGDAKALLPPLIDRLDTIDMFFHDSDHTYNHMTFELDQAVRKLAPNGVIIADDIAWNASLWDFADRHNVPGYNYGGTMGVAFLSG